MGFLLYVSLVEPTYAHLIVIYAWNLMWFRAYFTVYMLYLFAFAAAAFNLAMVWPHETWLYVVCAKYYQIGLSVPIYTGNRLLQAALHKLINSMLQERYCRCIT